MSSRTPAAASHPLAILSIMSIASLEFIQNGMLNFASVNVIGGLGAAPEEFSYAAMAYAACAVVALFNHRWCAEHFGVKRFVQLSLLLFTLGGLCCALAQIPAAFILGRAIQGLGGATFFTAARVEVNRLEGKARLFGLLFFGYALLFGSAFGPVLGSVALHHADWRAIFWGMTPWLIFAGLASARLHETPEVTRASRYHPGALRWLVVAVFLLQFMIQQTPYDYFSRPALLLTLLGCTLIAGLIFQARHRTTAADLHRWRKLTQARYLFGLSFYFVCYFLVGANSYIMPVMVQQALGFDVPTTGLLLSVSFFAGVVFATLYVRLQLVFQTTWLRPGLAFGALMLSAYGFFMSQQTDTSTFWGLAAILVLNGGFMSVFIISAAQGTFKEIDPDAFTHAYQTKNIVRQIALSCAVSFSVVFLQSRTALHGNRLSEGFCWTCQNFLSAIDQIHQALPNLSQSQIIGTLAQELARQSTLLSCLDYFQAECWIGLALALWIFVQKRFY